MLFISLPGHFSVKNFLNVKQNLKMLRFECIPVLKNVVRKSLKCSVYLKFKALNSRALILLYFKGSLFDLFLTSNLELLSLKLLAIKLNSKIYHVSWLKNNYSLNYTYSKFFLFQFEVYSFKKNSK